MPTPTLGNIDPASFRVFRVVRESLNKSGGQGMHMNKLSLTKRVPDVQQYQRSL